MKVDEMIKKFKLEIAYRNGEKGITFKKKPSNREVAELKEKKGAIIEELENRKARIDEYFENLNNVEIYCLHYSHYYIDEETEGYKETKELNKKYFEEVEAEWIKNNKKNFVETRREVELYEDNKTFYVYAKETSNVEVKENKEEQENIERTIELEEMAERMNDEDFEDITGLPREHYLRL